MPTTTPAAMPALFGPELVPLFDDAGADEEVDAVTTTVEPPIVTTEGGNEAVGVAGGVPVVAVDVDVGEELDSDSGRFVTSTCNPLFQIAQ